MADKLQVGIHPFHSVLTFSIGRHVAAGVLLDLVLKLELPVAGIADGTTQLDPSTFSGRLLPR